LSITADTVADASTADVQRAVAQRLRACAAAVLEMPPGVETNSQRDASVCLAALVERLSASRDPALAWLLLTTLAGAYPSADDVRALRRSAELSSPLELTLALLDRTAEIAAVHGTADCLMTISSGVVVDVDSCARSTFHNGIQRTAREAVRRWRRQHDVTLVAWTDTAGITRALDRAEELRAAHWGEASEVPRPDEPPLVTHAQEVATPERPLLVVPWRATLVLVEVPLSDRCPGLAALAEFSGTAIVAIGYDAIPVVSADLRPLGEPNAFTSYLTVVKHAARIVGISSSATVEFEGFRDALASQGLSGPQVSEVPLPTTVPAAPPGYVRHPPARPKVLSVGRLEPHTNHGALLHAAERLWREGIDFELELIGGPGWDTTSVDRQLARLADQRRPIVWRGSVPDRELWTSIRAASFTVFISLHEGFGLPVAESLACGTPVMTTKYGSQGEIAQAGGCLTVDPRDDEDVLSVLRLLLTSPETRRRLRDEAAARAPRTWQDYADELWDTLIPSGVRS
jgi:glycosyltransferase involved in cell wall biosynthesis